MLHINNLRIVTKTVVVKGKLMALDIYFMKNDSSKINDLSLHLKNQEKKNNEQNKRMKTVERSENE